MHCPQIIYSALLVSDAASVTLLHEDLNAAAIFCNCTLGTSFAPDCRMHSCSWTADPGRCLVYPPTGLAQCSSLVRSHSLVDSPADQLFIQGCIHAMAGALPTTSTAKQPQAHIEGGSLLTGIKWMRR